VKTGGSVEVPLLEVLWSCDVSGASTFVEVVSSFLLRFEGADEVLSASLPDEDGDETSKADCYNSLPSEDYLQPFIYLRFALCACSCASRST